MIQESLNKMSENKRGKLIVFEGNDASGKATHSRKVVDRLNLEGIASELESFPMYNTSSGKIVGGPLLGKPEICDSYFEDPANEDAKVVSQYYAADRRRALPWMNSVLDSGKNLILDRYVGSNMGHQGGKIFDSQERLKLFKDLDYLEYGFNELSRPDLTVFLYVPHEVGIELKSGMNVKKDRVEENKEYLKNSEEAYLQLADFYDWKKVDLTRNGKMDSIDENHEKIYKTIKENLDI